MDPYHSPQWCQLCEHTVLCMQRDSQLGGALLLTFMNGLVPFIFWLTKNGVYFWPPQYLPQIDPPGKTQSLQLLLDHYAEDQQLWAEKGDHKFCCNQQCHLNHIHTPYSISIMMFWGVFVSGVIWNKSNTVVELISHGPHLCSGWGICPGVPSMTPTR